MAPCTHHCLLQEALWDFSMGSGLGTNIAKFLVGVRHCVQFYTHSAH